MSRTIGSPARITRSDASWCGDAEFGPRRDDRELGELVALGEEPLADLVARRRPRSGRRAARRRSGRRPGRRPRRRGAAASISSASLTSAASRSDGRRRRRTSRPAARPGGGAGGATRAGPRRAIAGRPTARRPRRDELGRRARADRRSPSRSRSRMPTAAAGLAAAGSSSRGTTSVAGPAARPTTSIVSRSSGMRAVAGQVARSGPTPIEQRRRARPRSRRASGARRAVPRTARRGSSVASATSSWRAGSAGTGARSQPATAIVAGPSSNSLRYARTLSAPAARARLRSATSSCWPTARTRARVGARARDRGDAVVGAGGQVDDHGVGRGRGPGSSAASVRTGAALGRRRPRTCSMQPRRPDQVVGEDERRAVTGRRAARSAERSRRGAGRRRAR